jgi:hypothetical protein
MNVHRWTVIQIEFGKVFSFLAHSSHLGNLEYLRTNKGLMVYRVKDDEERIDKGRILLTCQELNRK